MGLKRGFLPVKYLGVPLTCRKLSGVDCRPLVDKITARITSWASKFLSYARSLQLIESMLSSLYGYWCPVFLLPMHLIKLVERLRNSFLWKGMAGVATGAWVSWALVCRPKTEGVLGSIGKQTGINLALLVWFGCYSLGLSLYGKPGSRKLV